MTTTIFYRYKQLVSRSNHNLLFKGLFWYDTLNNRYINLNNIFIFTNLSNNMPLRILDNVTVINKPINISIQEKYILNNNEHTVSTESIYSSFPTNNYIELTKNNIKNKITNNIIKGPFYIDYYNNCYTLKKNTNVMYSMDTYQLV
jgi:hypothetical protein